MAGSDSVKKPRTEKSKEKDEKKEKHSSRKEKPVDIDHVSPTGGHSSHSGKDFSLNSLLPPHTSRDVNTGSPPPSASTNVNFSDLKAQSSLLDARIHHIIKPSQPSVGGPTDALVDAALQTFKEVPREQLGQFMSSFSSFIANAGGRYGTAAGQIRCSSQSPDNVSSPAANVDASVTDASAPIALSSVASMSVSGHSKEVEPKDTQLLDDLTLVFKGSKDTKSRPKSLKPPPKQAAPALHGSDEDSHESDHDGYTTVSFQFMI